MSSSNQQQATSLVERILAESPLGLSAAARRLGTFRDGAATHPSTLSRWATKGIRLADGSTLKLETVRLNGRLVTSWPALVRFVQAQQVGLPAIGPKAITSAKHDRSEQAVKELELIGA